ncbi:hypothetical protein [Cryptosporangium japonicum]|uniref:Uncharacterized protein n=1 Tax=Cryptosporangium japonicum TaxID=80872 RepID=A0ABP3E4X4_9ACTN
MGLDTIDHAPTETWSPPPPISWPPAPAPPRRRRPSLAALLGLLCGALVVGSVWLGSSLVSSDPSRDAAGPTGPAGDAAAACRILADLPAFTADGVLNQDSAELRTAGELSAAAAADDERYRTLADATRRTYLASTELDPAAANNHREIALAEC